MLTGFYYSDATGNDSKAEKIRAAKYGTVGDK